MRLHLWHHSLTLPPPAPAPFSLSLSLSLSPLLLQANTAMVALMDDVVGNVTAAIRSKPGMWDNTLLLWSSDNGGASHRGGGANNFPLRGGYYNNWEGGIRVSALLAGGALPSAMRGKKMEGFVHEADWWATFCHLAGNILIIRTRI